MVEGRFGRATRVERVDVSDDGDVSSYRGEVHDGWDIGGNANGGYLLAIAGRAMSEAVGRPPLTLTAHYLRPAPAGPCTIDVRIVRRGRRFATLTANLDMDHGRVLQLLGTFGPADPDDDRFLHTILNPLDLPPYDACAERPNTAESPTLMTNLAVRLHPDDVGFSIGEPTGRPEVRGWFDLLDGEPIDEIGLLLATDVMPPSIFNTDLPAAWVPTVELTVHIRGVPAPGPLRCGFRSQFVQSGLTEEDGEIFDVDGNLVAQSRQLALLPRG
ncbi:MAG: thioesterase family protein [Actinomycetota bacterium]